MNRELQKPYEGAFIGDIHYFALRVYIEDTDLGGVVYYANYLRFLERARSDLLRSLGIDQRVALLKEGVYAVAELHIKYCSPARLNDDLIVLSRVEEIRGASCSLGQKIIREQNLLSDATVRIAFLSPEGRPKRQPLDWVQRLERVKRIEG